MITSTITESFLQQHAKVDRVSVEWNSECKISPCGCSTSRAMKAFAIKAIGGCPFLPIYEGGGSLSKTRSIKILIAIIYTIDWWCKYSVIFNVAQVTSYHVATVVAFFFFRKAEIQQTRSNTSCNIFILVIASVVEVSINPNIYTGGWWYSTALSVPDDAFPNTYCLVFTIKNRSIFIAASNDGNDLRRKAWEY